MPSVNLKNGKNDDIILWPKMALEMFQEFLTVSLDITNKASPRLSLVEKFAQIAVYK